jgi:hypothetical protein
MVNPGKNVQVAFGLSKKFRRTAHAGRRKFLGAVDGPSGERRRHEGKGIKTRGAFNTHPFYYGLVSLK